MERYNLLHKAVRSVSSFLAGPTASTPEPRKGTTPMSSTRARYSHFTDGLLVRENPTVLPMAQYQFLADKDDIIFAIRQALRRAIGELPWKIVPDIDVIKSDLKRWQTVCELNLAMPGLGLDFVPQAISLEFFTKANGALKDLLRSIHEEGGDDALKNSVRLREFFENCLAYHNVIAESHVSRVKRLFEAPNATDLAMRTFLDQVVDGLTMLDCAPIVKNPSVDGRSLAEIYLLPGSQVRVYKCKDLSIPQPPNAAYDWSNGDRVLAYYNNLELLYMVANPQASGYGKPPMEVLLEQMLSSLYGDAYLLDFFANNNMPRGVFDLGPSIDEGERAAIEERWNNQVRQGLRRVLFVSNAEGVKGWVPIPQDSNKDLEIVELQKHWANRKCAAFGLSLNDIGFTEDLHRTTSETQHDLTQSRGINSLATIIADKFNGEIVKGHMWVREDPWDPTCMAGHAVPIFPFRDVKFEFVKNSEDAEESAHEAEVALINAGVKSRNEVRKDHGLPPIVGGDVHTIGEGSSVIKVADLPQIPAPQAQTPADPQQQGAPQNAPALPQPKGDGPPTSSVQKSMTDFAQRLADIVNS